MSAELGELTLACWRSVPAQSIKLRSFLFFLNCLIFQINILKMDSLEIFLQIFQGTSNAYINIC